ncbi:MAG: methyltransferase domain-containing protein, partial [Rhodospirillaceae bacterium]
MTTPHTPAPEAPIDGEEKDLSLKTKFIAWWEGYDLSGKKKKKKQDADLAKQEEAANKADLNRHGKPLWSASRIEVAEKIWGTGFVLPGGVELIQTLTKPLGLNPAMTVLELGAGLGGATRVMAACGCWVTGLEASPFLAEHGMERSTKAGLAKQAPIEVYDPENFKYSKRVDAVFAKDVFFTIKDKTTLFDRVEAILKPRGQFLFTDYVIEPDKRNAPAIVSWSDREPLEPNLWTLQGALDAFAQCNLDLRVHEDITAPHRMQILAAIKSLTEHL